MAYRKRKVIICEQYGFYWKFNLKGFLALCKEGTKTGRHNLNDYGKELKNKPFDIMKPQWASAPFSGSSEVMLIHPLDWHRGDYEQAAIEATEWWNEREMKR